MRRLAKLNNPRTMIIIGNNTNQIITITLPRGITYNFE